MQISLGSVTSQPGVSTSALAFEDRIFTMTPSGSSPDVISGKDNVYQMCFSDPNQGLASAQYITEQGWVRRSLSSGKMTMCIPPALRNSL